VKGNKLTPFSIREFRVSNFALRVSLAWPFLFCLSQLLLSPGLSGRDLPPVVPPPKPLVLPAPEVRVLPNGLKIMVIERHALPFLTLRLVVKAGVEADPPELPGTAQLVAALLDQGTERRSAQAIAEAIDSAGGTIETGADWDYSFASINVLSDHAELAFDLLADMVPRPAFAPAEVERKRQQTLSALEVARGDPSYLADTAFDCLIFAGTPYSHPPDGTAEIMRKFTVEDLRKFHARHYRPSNAVLAVVGDMSAAEAFERSQKVFENWQEKSGSSAPAPTPTIFQKDSRETVVIDRPDAVQTEIRIGNAGIPRDSPDYYALTVANQILGGPANNRLFRALRSQQGLTYSASSDLLCLRSAGSWVAKTSTRTAETLKTAQMVLAQMKRLRAHTINDQELESAKGYLVGHLALEFESSRDIATHYLELVVQDLPLDYWNRFPENVRAVGREEVLSAARRFLDPKHNVMVLVGNAADFREDSKKLGPFRVIPLSRLDFASESLEKPAATAGKR
jgi:zinc protease